MVIIFKLSSQPANKSNKLRMEITKVYIKVIKKVNPNVKLNIERFHHLIRRNGHFFVFCSRDTCDKCFEEDYCS